MRPRRAQRWRCCGRTGMVTRRIKLRHKHIDYARANRNLWPRVTTIKAIGDRSVLERRASAGPFRASRYSQR